MISEEAQIKALKRAGWMDFIIAVILQSWIAVALYTLLTMNTIYTGSPAEPLRILYAAVPASIVATLIVVRIQKRIRRPILKKYIVGVLAVAAIVAIGATCFTKTPHWVSLE
mgnify:CR=1 FL=1